MEVIGLCRFSYSGIGGFQVEHGSVQERMDYLYQPDRMEERFRTFEGMTLPSLKRQTDPDFTLLIVIGDSLSAEHRSRLQSLVSDLPQAVIKSYAPGPHRKVMQSAINDVRRFDGSPCLQFRMDDDDAVALSFVQKLRAVANDLRAFAGRHRHIAIDFNQGFIVRPGPLGLWAAQSKLPFTTAALALMVRSDVRMTIMNFAHSKIGKKMPTVTLTGEDMFIRGHNDFNDSRQKEGIKPLKLERLEEDAEKYVRDIFAVDSEHVRQLYAGT